MKSKISFFFLSLVGGSMAFSYQNNFFKNTNENNFDSQTKIVNESPKFTMVNASTNVPKELDFTNAAEKTVNAVVHISSEFQQTYPSDPMMEFFGDHKVLE